MLLPGLATPIVQAPMGGGVSTPALAAAVAGAGGLGFVAGGYLGVPELADQLRAARALTAGPVGVNLFSPPAPAPDRHVIDDFRDRIEPMARAAGVDLGTPRHDDDHYEDKISLVATERPPVVSFAFGCPSAEVVETLHAAGVRVWVTVTNVDEAAIGARVGADAVIAQGAEAGAHRSSFVDDDGDALPLHQLLELILTSFGRGGGPPIVAAGGVMTGAHIAEALRSGAAATQLGTAFMLCPEAGTSAVHRGALAERRDTVLTRAFTGRLARGLVNRWTEAFTDGAPRAYPDVHHLTAPVRAHGRTTGDPELVNLWAGANYRLARALPAADVVAVLMEELASAGPR